jgi:predicted GIY-YIG superfamily endonuclease
MAFLYILRNATGMTYLGMSQRPLIRLKQHNSAARTSQRHYTNRHRPWTMVAVVNGFTTRAQALRAEYMIKHQPHKIRHSVAIVARIATAQATCNRLLRADRKFSGVKALAVVIWEQDLHQTVQCLTSSLASVAGGGVTLQHVG